METILKNRAPQHYSASITPDRVWDWDGKHQPEYRHGMPYFLRGDTLRLRLQGCEGLHQIQFIGIGERDSPFSHPYDGPQFSYLAEDRLPIPDIEYRKVETWNFNLSKDGRGVDPEFQVGPGHGEDAA
jgi:hypothetical protein